MSDHFLGLTTFLFKNAPHALDSLKRIADALEKQNELIEKKQRKNPNTSFTLQDK